MRNTEEAEKNSRSPDSTLGGESGRGLGKGVWGMIDESELAKRIREGEEKKVSRKFPKPIPPSYFIDYLSTGCLACHCPCTKEHNPT